MRYLKKLALLILVLLTGFSCQDSLELENPNTLTADTFFKSPEQLQAAVDAIYADFQTEDLFMRNWYYIYDNMSGDVRATPQHEANKRVFKDFTWISNDEIIEGYWENAFRGVNKANFVIFNQDNFENVTDEQINQAVGEARFLHAYYLFILVTRFGDIPLITEPTAIDQPRSPAEQVYEAIITDLEDAAGKLSSRTGTQGGRPSSGAAYALLGKVHLYLKNYQAAFEAFSNINGYDLATNYEDNFLEETEYNIESLFEITFIGEPQGYDWNGVNNGQGFNELTFRGQDMGWNDWFNSYPSPDLIDEYEDGDPRFGVNFYQDGDLFNNGTQTVTIPDVAEGFAWKKYQNYYKREKENSASGINPRIIRYADVLLMQAETELFRPGGSISEAIDLMNRVRDRVGMPRYGTPAMNTTYPVGNQQQVFDALIHERRVELAGEQVRFDDLLRWGLAADELSPFGYQEGKHNLWPIPEAEINANSAISVADQNPGY
ncbi:MAG: RagB/SusD family nutrient uptake outer membrane protein [Cyclobacteriaceae bacterium]